MAGEFQGEEGVSRGAFEAASPGQSKEPGQSKRLEQITALRFNYNPPDTTSLLFVFTALAYHRAAPPGSPTWKHIKPLPTFLPFFRSLLPSQ